MNRIAIYLIAACTLYWLFYLIFSPEFASWGSTLGLLLALIWDSWSIHQLEAWLKARLARQSVPLFTGFWQRISEPVHHAFRHQDQLLEASEQRLNDFLSAIQASSNGVILLDAQARIEWCNATGAQLFGLDAQRDLQQHLSNLVRAPELLAYLQSGDYSTDVIFETAKSTAQHPQRVSVQLHRYGSKVQGQISKLLLLARDMTLIEQAAAQRRDFVANVSHEIRTPLTVLSGFIETLQSLPLREDQRQRYLTLMQEQSQRMQNLVSDLLTLSKLEASPAPTLSEPLSCQLLLQRLERDARALSLGLDPQKQHRLQINFPIQDFYILGDETEIISACSNLLNNAVRYTPAGGKIEVYFELQPNGQAKYSVKDSGAGIAPEHLNRLTERFYRVDDSRSRASGGTGLGLSIVKHVVNRHGGQLLIESVLNQGSTFSFSLPAARVKLSQ